MRTKTFLQNFLIYILLVSATDSSLANNITLSNTSLTGQNTTNHYSFIKFDIQWENSWRTSPAPSNWDAAWVFAKFRVGTGEWQHAWLNNTGHFSPSGSTISTGLLYPDSSFNQSTNPGTGVFIYRDADGTGTFSKAGLQLRWNYGANGLSDNDIIDLRIYAIELVYVPQGSFYIGSGGTETSAFYKYPVSTNPYQITSENAVQVGATNDYLYYNQSTYGGDRLGPIPASFPKGYRAFYCMKYEISQQGYVDFLNTLNIQQSNNRHYNISPTSRYSIIKTNGVFSTTNPYIACNFLNWGDKAAYFDWSGLRPLTELEYEKACRGPNVPVPEEYAWGTTDAANGQYALSNTGASNEIISSNYSTTTGNAAYNLTASTINGPLRVGIFAGNTGNTGRVTSGATYYGIMEMSGNLLEHFITAGNSMGRSFTGLHGNGMVNTAGNSDVAGWPGISSYGAGFRGGYWSYYAWYMRVSDRSGAAGTDAGHYDSDGGRGGRTAP